MQSNLTSKHRRLNIGESGRIDLFLGEEILVELGLIARLKGILGVRLGEGIRDGEAGGKIQAEQAQALHLLGAGQIREVRQAIEDQEVVRRAERYRPTGGPAAPPHADQPQFEHFADLYLRARPLRLEAAD